MENELFEEKSELILIDHPQAGKCGLVAWKAAKNEKNFSQSIAIEPDFSHHMEVII